MKNDETLQHKETQYQEPCFITIAELMKRTTLSRPTICRHIKEGIIPAVKIGSRVLVDFEYLVQLQNAAAYSTMEDKKA